MGGQNLKNLNTQLEQISTPLPSKKFFSPCNHFAKPTFSNFSPEKMGSRHGGTFYIPELQTTIKGKLWMISPEKSITTSINTSHVSGGKFGQSWFCVVFFKRERYFHKNPRIYGYFRYFPRAIILHTLCTFGRQEYTYNCACIFEISPSPLTRVEMKDLYLQGEREKDTSRAIMELEQ